MVDRIKVGDMVYYRDTCGYVKKTSPSLCTIEWFKKVPDVYDVYQEYDALQWKADYKRLQETILNG